MTEYTKEFTEKFWAACGIHCHLNDVGSGLVCEKWSDDGITCYYSDDKLPSLSDLNALFKYAVPIVFIRLWTVGEHAGDNKACWKELFDMWLENFFNGMGTTEALVSAVSKAFGLEVNNE